MELREFPEVNYTRCQETGRRGAREGNPLLGVPSVRHQEGVNLVAFNASVLSNSREYCKITLYSKCQLSRN